MKPIKLFKLSYGQSLVYVTIDEYVDFLCDNIVLANIRCEEIKEYIFTKENVILTRDELYRLVELRSAQKKLKMEQNKYIEKLDWLWKKYNASAICHVCFEVIYQYVKDISTDKVEDVEKFYRYVTNELDQIFNNVSEKTGGEPESEQCVKLMSMFCKRLSNIIYLPVDIETWWHDKTGGSYY